MRNYSEASVEEPTALRTWGYSETVTNRFLSNSLAVPKMLNFYWYIWVHLRIVEYLKLETQIIPTVSVKTWATLTGLKHHLPQNQKCFNIYAFNYTHNIISMVVGMLCSLQTRNVHNTPALGFRAPKKSRPWMCHTMGNKSRSKPTLWIVELIKSHHRSSPIWDFQPLWTLKLQGFTITCLRVATWITTLTETAAIWHVLELIQKNKLFKSSKYQCGVLWC